MVDLRTSYLGIELKNPLIAGASGLTSDLETIKKIEQAGAGAIVCKSLFEEEIRLEAMEQEKELHKYDDIHAEMVTVFPDIKEKGPEYHLYWVKKTKENSSIPVIGSLNAVNSDVWVEYARLLEETGVDALELNFYNSANYDKKSSGEIEQDQIETLKKIRKTVDIPISVKLSPYYTNPENFIAQLDNIGVDGFVLFNRFFQSNINIETEEFTFPFNFSHKDDNRLPLKYTGLLSGSLNGSISSSTGIMDYDDVIRMLLAGADTVQLVTTLYKNGINHLGTILSGLEKWMEDKGYSSIDDFRGSMSRKNLGQKEHWAYMRSGYVKMLMQKSRSLADKIF